MARKAKEVLQRLQHTGFEIRRQSGSPLPVLTTLKLFSIAVLLLYLRMAQNVFMEIPAANSSENNLAVISRKS